MIVIIDKAYIKGYLNRIDENTIIFFAKNNGVDLSYLEASSCLLFLKKNIDQLLICENKKEYIYYYFNDPFAQKLCVLVDIITSKL